MAWENPKQNWGDPGQTVPGTDDFKRIEGNEQYLKDSKMDISGGEFTGITKAHSNTSYTTKQIRNIILSPDNANVSLMADGDIWMKYK